jgi:hypothetical protein
VVQTYIGARPATLSRQQVLPPQHTFAEASGWTCACFACAVLAELIPDVKHKVDWAVNEEVGTAPSPM